MSMHRVAVLKVVSAQLSVTAAAAECGISRGHLHRLLRRYREEGLDAVEPRSRRPRTSPRATPGAVRDRITALRIELAARGHDGWPAATLTDNGSVYTSRFTGGRNGFEYLLAYLGIRQKNGSPGHPQTQGKIERFHQTLKRWLGRRPAASGLAGLQAQLDAFREVYNEQRPHRAIGRRTPGEAYRAMPKAMPSGAGGRGHFRLRYDTTDGKGAMTLRRGGRLYHLKVGVAWARRRVLAIVDEQEVTVVALDTGEILSTHRIEPDKGYWRNTRRDPGRWPGPQQTG